MSPRDPQAQKAARARHYQAHKAESLARNQRLRGITDKTTALRAASKKCKKLRIKPTRVVRLDEEVRFADETQKRLRREYLERRGLVL